MHIFRSPTEKELHILASISRPLRQETGQAVRDIPSTSHALLHLTNSLFVLGDFGMPTPKPLAKDLGYQHPVSFETHLKVPQLATVE